MFHFSPMTKRCLWLFLLLPLLTACPRGEESGLEGTLLFAEKPLAGAQLEVYLKNGKDRSTLPFAVTSTDAAGRYRLNLPAGRYFLIGKKKEEKAGRVRMLMAECPVNPVEVGNEFKKIEPFPLREMGQDGVPVPDPGTGVTGRIVAGGAPVAGAFVYVYSEDIAGLMGPSYGEAVQTALDGRFQIDLRAGRYYLAARLRSDGSRMGEPQPGDLNGTYPGNPVVVPRGTLASLGDFPLKPVDGSQRLERLKEGKFTKTKTFFSGRIVDQDSVPVEGVYVFAYLDSRMVGKPSYISDPSDGRGRYVLYLGAGGTYYIGARSTFGGPLEPGEWVGTYGDPPDNGMAVASGASFPLGDLVVREVW
jgi:hypothetical protein